ncbi:BREX-1 system phosphatase PglZ type A [Jeotgalibaca sp. A127]|uniref:BREX-1 system phosphatase PglZ type A n=1 Tax=Jeotgalibaca sp. A127 TaxID=3457324 RepID=UPI003FD52948
MAQLSLNQISDKLNQEFNGDTRNIVFWYDDKGEFEADITDLRLEKAKVIHLTKTNLFQTKILLERTDPEGNYLVYAPYPKPPSRDNHLADTIKYSKEFFADRASLLMVDLNIPETYKHVIQKYLKFFAAKDRTQRFYDLELDHYTTETIEVGLMSALTKSKNPTFEEVVRTILVEDDLENSGYLAEFEKYQLDEAFWKLCSQEFGYIDENPSIVKLLMTFFVTYTSKTIKGDLPNSLKPYLATKAGSVRSFMDQMMNSILYREKFNGLSEKIFRYIDGERTLSTLPSQEVVDLEVFPIADEIMIKWMIGRLLAEDLNAEIEGKTIPQLTKYRDTKHFSERYTREYHMLKHAYYVINSATFVPENDILTLIKQYDEQTYFVDTHYRKFYYYYDQLSDVHKYDDLRSLVENIYTNRYLDVIIKKFNELFSYEKMKDQFKLQKDFYKNFVRGNRERTIVIISDGLRYEVAKELVKRFQRDEKTSATIEPQIGVLPSYTQLGMASLLPHRALTISEDYAVKVDGKPTDTLKARQDILQAVDPDSLCIQFDEVKRMKQQDLRDTFQGKSTIYIYHNQIDGRGDKAVSEDEVFNSCEEAITEIFTLIKRLTTQISASSFLVTADHGFIYKREKLEEGAKIEKFFEKTDQINRRFIVTENIYEEIGTQSMSLKDVIDEDDGRYVVYPSTSNVFKIPGGGQNYVHGGSSPQELLIPVVQVKTQRGYVETEDAKISLVSSLHKVTNLILNLDFIQKEAISNVVKPATYKVFFMDEEENLISNENIHVANNKESDASKRLFKLRFSLKNQTYNRSNKYYLVAINEQTGLRIMRHEIMVDIAFAGDFGF